MAVASGPFCSNLGCREETDVIIQNPRGRYYACEDHADDGEVVDDV